MEKILEKVRDIEGWLSDEVAELLIHAAENTPDEGIVLEIGSWKGKSTLCFALADHKKKIYAVDPFEGSQEHQYHSQGELNTFEEFKANLENQNVWERVNPIVMTSKMAALKVEEPISVLWIDGSHEYQDVKLDFELWFDQVLDGGLILFHDSKWDGVRQVLWEEFYTCPLLGPVQRIEDTTFARKLAEPSQQILEYNQELLNLERSKQQVKRLGRKLRKIFPDKIEI